MKYLPKHLIGSNDEDLGKWSAVSPEEHQAISESLVDTNYARGAVGKPSLRLYYQDGYAVICTQGVPAENHPTAGPPKPVDPGRPYVIDGSTTVDPT